MHGVNLKPTPSVPLASTNSRPAMANSVWKAQLDATPIKSEVVAKLLQRAGIIGKEQYCDAVEIAESLGKSIDQVIATSFLTEFQAVLAGNALSYLERGIINDALAADALALANRKAISFSEGLKYFGFGW